MISCFAVAGSSPLTWSTLDKIRALGERANATLKTWKVLARLHCCPQRATTLLAAIFVLQLTEEQRKPR